MSRTKRTISDGVVGSAPLKGGECQQGPVPDFVSAGRTGAGG